MFHDTLASLYQFQMALDVATIRVVDENEPTTTDVSQKGQEIAPSGYEGGRPSPLWKEVELPSSRLRLHRHLGRRHRLYTVLSA